MKRKTSLLPMTLINRFEKICGTFRRGGEKNILSSMTLGQFTRNQKIKNLNFYKKQK
jgi:hypothetical protein